MSEIPVYVKQRWEDFVSGRYGEEVARYAPLFKMELDPSRPPFIFAGNLENRARPRILTFGLAPHAKAEYVPQTLEGYYDWRLNYFDSSKMPHTIHRYFARLCWGMLGLPPPDSQFEAQWLHENGYLTFDLIPYYVKDWKAPNWRKPELLPPVRQHVQECLHLVQDDEIGVAIFSGKAWEELLLPDAGVQPLFPFDLELPSFRLSEARKESEGEKPWPRCQVTLGRLGLGDRTIPAVVIGGLIHQIRGLSYDYAFDLGRFIGQRFPQMKFR